ncbi:7109_t:CDS:1 [Ambispora gerdemannii]|uniref:7109_t:CDS:1 n=1 Tax=Ambispora gerdemannii TaxID=144530 RepID=A0A9N9B552_9GLOM|nr:7109_t:CDS:1 [Ambispora gerdemannii]
MSGKNSILAIFDDHSKVLIVDVSNQKCAHFLYINIPTFMEYKQRVPLKTKISNCFLIFRWALNRSRQTTWKCTNSGCLLHKLLDRNGCSKLASKIWDQLNEETKKPFKDLYNTLKNHLENQRILIESSPNGLSAVDRSALPFQQLPLPMDIDIDIDIIWQNLPMLIDNYNFLDTDIDMVFFDEN